MTGKEKGSKRTRPSLSPLELEVMNVVWDLGDCTSGQVVAEFVKTRPLAPTTIRTVLANLRKKGYLKPMPTIERGFRLRPVVERESVARRSLAKLLSGLFGGSPRQAIAYLLENVDISDAELDEIRRFIDERKKKGKQG